MTTPAYSPERRRAPRGAAAGAGIAPGTGIESVRALARVLDAAVRIPGTNVRIGLDPILGLIPGVGDFAGTALGAWIILVAWRAGAPAPVLMRMVGNVAIDSIVGAVPVLGDLFDVVWRSNTRNAALLEAHTAAPARTARASRGVLIAALAVVGLLLVSAIYASVALVRWVAGAF